MSCFCCFFVVDIFTDSSVVSTPIVPNLGEKPDILIDVGAMEKN